MKTYEEEDHGGFEIADSYGVASKGKVRDIQSQAFDKYAQRMQVIQRVGDTGGSVLDYHQILQTDAEERAHVGLQPGESPWSVATLFRWVKNTEDPQALSRSVGGTGRKCLLPNWSVVFILETLSWKPKCRIVDLTQGMVDFAEYHKLAVPSYSRVRRFVKAIKAFGGIQNMVEAIRKRKYHSKYDMATRHVYSFANQIWETDCTHLGLTLDNGDGLYSPWLMLTVDCFSGLPMGWSIPEWNSDRKRPGKKAGNDPDTNDLISHLKTCLLPKCDRAFWGGKPSILQSDNGAIYRAQAFMDVCVELGIKLRKSPPYCPSANGLIERLNKEVKKGFAAKFADFLISRGKMAREGRYVGTLESLRGQLNEFMLAYCATHTRREAGSNPVEQWQSGLKSPDAGCANRNEVSDKCLHYGDFPVTREGVLVRGVHFHDEECELRVSRQGRKGKERKVLVRYNPDGEPTVAIACVNGRDVRLVRNVETERRMVEIAKQTQTATREQLRRFEESLRESGRQNMPFIAANSTASIDAHEMAASLPENFKISKIKTTTTVKYL